MDLASDTTTSDNSNDNVSNTRDNNNGSPNAGINRPVATMTATTPSATSSQAKQTPVRHDTVVTEPLPSSSPDVTTRLLPPVLAEGGDVSDVAARAEPYVGGSATSATTGTDLGSFPQYSAGVEPRLSPATSRHLDQEAAVSERKGTLAKSGSFSDENPETQPLPRPPPPTVSQAQRAYNTTHHKDNVPSSESARRGNYSRGSVSARSEAGSLLVPTPTALVAAASEAASQKKSVTPLTTGAAATDAVISRGFETAVVSDVLLPFSEIITPFVTAASAGDGDGRGVGGSGGEREGIVSFSSSSYSATPPLVKSAFVTTTAPVTSTIATSATLVDGSSRRRGQGEVRTSQFIASSVETSFPSSVVGEASEAWGSGRVPFGGESDLLVSERAASGEEVPTETVLGIGDTFLTTTTNVEVQEGLLLNVTETNFSPEQEGSVTETSYRFSDEGSVTETSYRFSDKGNVTETSNRFSDKWNSDRRTPAKDLRTSTSTLAEEQEAHKEGFLSTEEDTAETTSPVVERTTQSPTPEGTSISAEKRTSTSEEKTIRLSRPTEDKSVFSPVPDSEKTFDVRAVVAETPTTQQQTSRIRKSTHSKEDKQQQHVVFTAVTSISAPTASPTNNTYTTTANRLKHHRKSGVKTTTATASAAAITTTTTSSSSSSTSGRNQGDIFLPSSSTRTKKEEGIAAANVAWSSPPSIFDYPTTTTPLPSQSSHDSTFLPFASSPSSPSFPPPSLSPRPAATDGGLKGGDVTGARGGGLLASVSIRAAAATTATSDGWDVSNTRRPTWSGFVNSPPSFSPPRSSPSPSFSLFSSSSCDVASSENPTPLSRTLSPPFFQTSTTSSTTRSNALLVSSSSGSVSVSPSAVYPATKTTPYATDLPTTQPLLSRVSLSEANAKTFTSPALSNTALAVTDVPAIHPLVSVSLWPTAPSSDSLRAAESLESPPTRSSVVVERADSEPNVNSEGAASLSVTSGVFVNSGGSFFTDRGAHESVLLTAGRSPAGGISSGGRASDADGGKTRSVGVVATATAEDGDQGVAATATGFVPITATVVTPETASTARVFAFISSAPESAAGPVQTDLFPSSPLLGSSAGGMAATPSLSSTGVTPSLRPAGEAGGAAGGRDVTAASPHLLTPSQSPPPPAPPLESASTTLVSPPPTPRSSDDDASPPPSPTRESSLSVAQPSQTFAGNASSSALLSSPTPGLGSSSSAGLNASPQFSRDDSSAIDSSSLVDTSSPSASVVGGGASGGGGGGSGVGEATSSVSVNSSETSTAATVHGGGTSSDSSLSGSGGSSVTLVNVTGSAVADGSGDVSGDGEVIDSTTATTVISPTPSSAVLCSTGLMVESTASTNGNGSAFNVDGGPGVSALVIALPVCLGVLVLIAVVVTMSLLCFRRKKKKKGKRRRSHDDLWVEPSADRVSDLALPGPPEVPPATTPTITYAAVQNAHTESETQEEDTLYLVAHDFTGQLDTQMSLTSGDIVSVQEKADNGWWRGGVQGGDKTGWFPSSFVVPFTQEGVQTLNPEPAEEKAADHQTPKPRISSFLIRKLQVNRSLRDNNSFSLGKIQPSETDTTSAAVSRSASTLNPVAPVRLTSPSLTAEDFSSSVRGKYYKAMFSYKAAFRGELSLREGEVILGKERDRNGWMLGKKVHVKEEGWFPAVYVDEVQGDIPVSDSKGESDGGSEKKAGQLDHDVYGLLAVNRNKSPDHSWLAIEHRAVKEFTKASSAQMSLRVGNLVHVVEALDTGWWLGCQGDNVGWFPGEYVELLEEKSETTTGSDLADLDLLPATASFSFHPHLYDADNAFSTASKRSSLVSSVDAGDFTQQQHQQHNNNNKNKSADQSQESAPSGGEDGGSGKPKPARRAPKPPGGKGGALLLNGHNVSGTGTLSRNPRPMRPAPAPPTQKAGRAESIASMDRLGFLSAGMDRKSGAGSICGGSSVDEGSMVMHRKQRKPKVVRIPKEKVGLDKISSCPAPSSPPPPYCPLSSASSSVTVTGGGDDPSSSPPLSTHGRHAAKNDAEADDSGDNPSTRAAAPADDVTHSDDVSSGDGGSQSPLLPASERKNGNDNHAADEADDDDKSDIRNERSDTAASAGAPNDDKPSDVVGDLDDATDGSIFAPHYDGDEGSSSTDLLAEMKLLVPGLKDAPNSTNYVGGGNVTEVNRSTRESTPDTVAVVETSPTLTAPPSFFSEPTRPSQQSDNKDHDSRDGDDVGIMGSPVQSGDQRDPPSEGLNLNTGVFASSAAASIPSTTEESNSDSKHDSSLNRDKDAVAAEKSDLTDNFQNPLMSKESMASKSPGVYSAAPPPKYVPPPPGLLEETEELPPVDEELPSWPPSLAPPPPAQESLARTSPTPRPATGIWRFARSGNIGQSAAPKPVKLTKVAPPVLPKTGSLDANVEVPPSGSSGRVSKIVHQINRMMSVDEPPQAHQRKTSIQSDTAPAVQGENDAVAHVPVTTSDSRASSPNPVNTLPDPVTAQTDPSANTLPAPPVNAPPATPENESPLPPPPPELCINDEKENPETLANGGPPTSYTARSGSPSGGNAQQSNRNSEPGIASFLLEQDYIVEGEGQTSQHQGRRRYSSRESTPESAGEGGSNGTAASTKPRKKSRAPGPPKVPPPSPPLSSSTKLAHDGLRRKTRSPGDHQEA